MSVTSIQIRKWLDNKGVKCRVTKIGTKFKQAITVGEFFPDEILRTVVNIVYPDQDDGILEMGNISRIRITITHSQWDILLNS